MQIPLCQLGWLWGGDAGPPGAGLGWHSVNFPCRSWFGFVLEAVQVLQGCCSQAEQGWLRGEVCSAPRPTSGAAGGNKELEGDSGAPLSPRIFQATGDCAQHVKLGKEGRR